MKTLTQFFAVALAFFAISCNNEQSLQEYYVDHQGNSNFVMLDLPTSLLLVNQDSMTVEQRETAESIKKVNLLAFPKKEDNAGEYNLEKEKINAILAKDKFQVLMKFNNNGTNAKVMYLGEEDAIDEVILYGESDKMGFGLARVLGKNMKPANIIKFMETMDSGMINIDGFGGVEDFVKEVAPEN